MSRRLSVMVAGAAMAAAILMVVLVMGALTEKVEAAPRFKTVTKTFSNTQQIFIPDAGPIPDVGGALPYPSAIGVRGFRQGKIQDVNLTLKGYSHARIDDVSVLLQGPKGHDAVLMSDVGGNQFNDTITLRLDDEATRKLPDSNTIASGTFKPTQGTAEAGTNPRPSVYPGPARFPPYGKALSLFDGTNPNGTWRLFVYDDTNITGEIDRGAIFDGWSLKIKAKVRRR